MKVGRHMKPLGVGSAPVTRPCLKCKKPFESEWIGNRLCDHCKEYNGLEIIADNAYGGRHMTKRDN